jgi:hypothetical protein
MTPLITGSKNDLHCACEFYTHAHACSEPANFTLLTNANLTNPLKSGNIADDMEIARLQELLRIGQLSPLRKIFTPGENRFRELANP